MDEDDVEGDDDWAPLAVWALYDTAPRLDNPLLLQVLREDFVAVAVADESVVITHPSILCTTVDGDPAWGATRLRPAAVPRLDDYDARPCATLEAPTPEVRTVRAAVRVTEELPSDAVPERRRAAFAAVLTALAAATPVVAYAWELSRTLTEPQPRREEWGFLGLRRRPSDVDSRGFLVESLGLSTFETPDVSCHFVGLDADAVSAQVAGHALGLLNGTEFIGDGDLVMAADAPWFTAVWTWGGDPERHLIELVADAEHRLGPAPEFGEDD